MQRLGCSAALIVCALLLSGCGVAYDKTKGWANKLSDWAEQELESIGSGENGDGRPRQSALVADRSPSGETATSSAHNQTASRGARHHQKSPRPKGAASTGLARVGNRTPPQPQSKPKIGSTSPNARHAASSRVEARESGYIVHLSSMRSQSSAHREWQALQRTYPRYLRKLKLSIEKVDLGERGVFYRVLAGPFADKRTALQVCSGLQEQQQYCKITQPKAAARG